MSAKSAAPEASAAAKAQIGAFSLLGRLVVRAPWLVIVAWFAAAAILAMAFTPLTKVVETQPLQPLPPKAMAAAEQMAKDFGESA
jgi:RND superfamily putative drug exporter